MSGRALTDELWSSIEGIYGQILVHPFFRGLTSGDLDRDAFRFYIVQDALYLVDYARALSIAAAKSPEAETMLVFSRNATQAIEVESALHETFFLEFGLSEEDVRATPKAPVNLAYTSYLLSVGYGGSFADGLGALLPCFWIYWEVGKALLERGSPDPLFRRWIDTYAGEEYGDTVRTVLDVTNRLGAELSPAERARMGEHFVQTSRYEWMFWDMGYRQEPWPV